MQKYINFTRFCYFCRMYRSVRITRIVISLIAMGVPTWALLAGYESVFVRMQIFTALLSGASVCLLFWLVVTLIYGRIYCSTACPMGTLMDCVSATSRIVRRRRCSYRYTPPSPRTRVIFLIITLGTFIVGGSLFPTLLDPYSAYARMVEELIARPLGLDTAAVAFTATSLAVAAATALAVGVAAWKNGRIGCNTVCPVGTILGYVGSKSYFHIEIDPDKCIKCGECERVCKSQCIKLPEMIVNNSRCVVCFDCTSVCPNNAIIYKTGRFRLDMPMMQSISNGTAKSQPSGTNVANYSKKEK